MTFRKTTVLTLLILLPMLAELAGSPPLRAQAAPLAALPATDVFGYTAEIIAPAPYQSICNLGGGEINFENTPLEGFSVPLDFGFGFPFYEKTHNTFRVSINGLITFSDSTLEPYDHLPMPVDLLPNDLVAPFWTDLELSTGTPAGRVCYQYNTSGQYMAVEWENVKLTDIADVFTFQALLYQNGNIEFQYPTSIPKVDNATVGIEDGEGIFGLQAFYNEGGLPVNSAIRILRPAAAQTYGRFVPTFASNFLVKRVANVDLTLQNISGVTKTFDLAHGGTCDWQTGGWEVTFYQGSTKLGDTNSNGCQDIQIPAGGQAALGARILAPQNVQVGDSEDFILTAMPNGQASGIVDMTLRAAVPASFAQAYVGKMAGDDQIIMWFSLIWEKDHIRKMAGDIFSGKNLAVSKTGSDGYFYTWERYHSSGSYLLGTIFTKFGTTIKYSYEITPVIAVSDEQLAVGSTPNGNLASVWIRNGNDLLINIYSPKGTLLVNQKKIPTGNHPSAPRIAADINNRFYIVWTQDGTTSSPGKDIYLSILSANGDILVAPKELANTTEDYSSPAITELISGGAIVAYSADNGSGTQPIAYCVIDANGNLTQGEKRIMYDGLRARGKDLVQLAGGKILVSWIDENTRHVHYTLLAKSTEWSPILATPIKLLQDYQYGANNVSVTADNQDHGIITWAEERGNRTISYALIDSAGSVLTPPMIFLTGTGLDTNAAGQGNAPYDGRQLLFIPLVTR